MGVIKMDLHNLHYDDARRSTIRFIELHWGHDIEVEIITGNSRKMKDVVEGVLKEYKLTYRIGREFDTNKGYIVVRM